MRNTKKTDTFEILISKNVKTPSKNSGLQYFDWNRGELYFRQDHYPDVLTNKYVKVK